MGYLLSRASVGVANTMLVVSLGWLIPAMPRQHVLDSSFPGVEVHSLLHRHGRPSRSFPLTLALVRALGNAMPGFMAVAAFTLGTLICEMAIFTTHMARIDDLSIRSSLSLAFSFLLSRDNLSLG